MIFAALVDTDALLKVVLYAFVAAVGVTTVFSFGIVGITRYDERRRQGGGGAAAYAALAFACAVIVAAVVVEAIIIMSKK
ncbi:MAG: hypothetical protein QOJ29_2551 [Thermoleophilaceae bacterium]|jgi:hypothetical protein|nr:hypothetical protein [Thermoleophilaceae bacterium]